MDSDRVNLREEIGPVLVPGQKYRLVIDATVEDLAQAIAATYHLPRDDKWGADMRHLLESGAPSGRVRAASFAAEVAS